MNNKVLVVFDLDYTLFRYEGEAALTYIVHKDTGEVLHSLNHEEIKDYVIPVDHKFDYRQFCDTQLFNDTAIPVKSILDILFNAKENGNDACIMTARANFDDPELLKKSLARYGIDVPIYCTGSFEGIKSQAHSKRIMFERLLENNDYNIVIFYDDSINNIKEFLLMSADYTDIQFNANYVQVDGDKANIRHMTLMDMLKEKGVME
jgi:hypothetical protein